MAHTRVHVSTHIYAHGERRKRNLSGGSCVTHPPHRVRKLRGVSQVDPGGMLFHACMAGPGGPTEPTAVLGRAWRAVCQALAQTYSSRNSFGKIEVAGASPF